MLPMRNIRLQLGTLLAEAPPISQDTNANIVRLIAAAFSEDEDLVVGDLTFANFDGSTAKVAPLADAQVGLDPNTGEQILTVNEPAGGWRWAVSGVTNLPQTIYGFAYLTAASAALIGVGSLETPIALTGVGQEINLGALKMRMVTQPLA